MTHKSTVPAYPPPILPDDSPSAAQFAADVRAGLGENGQKRLYPKYFYDALGSALFEAITLLPEYGLTRADARLLQEHTNDLIRLSHRPSVIAELGSGTGTKTRSLLQRVPKIDAVTYCPIDISGFALQKCEMDLQHVNNVRVHALQASYLAGLAEASQLRRDGTSMLTLFLGSTIGNFDSGEAEELCRNVRGILKPGDTFLLSTDLEKPVSRMIAAYDDVLGVTAAFNLNILARINRELQGNFDLGKFCHVASYDANLHRIEMHLRSIEKQTVIIDGDFAVTLQKGETIWTESSYKFRPKDLLALAERTGFRCEAQWVDDEWPFAQSVWRAI